MEKEKNNAIAFLIICFALLAYFFIPVPGTYRLKPGHAACPKSEDVVTYRGARMMGIFATSMVIASRKCVYGNETFKVVRRAGWLYLPYKLKLNGRVMYADHDALEKN